MGLEIEIIKAFNQIGVALLIAIIAPLVAVIGLEIVKAVMTLTR